jgi:16S rRNA (cytosine967-C5)-methyltransferase
VKQTRERVGVGSGAPRGAKKRPGKDERRKLSARPAKKTRAERSMREDLITQACLEAYGSVRHESRLADRALDFTLRTKRHLYSTERRAVAERVYALLRRQRLVDWLLEQSRPGFASISTSRKDLLRLAASRVLHGEAPDEVALGMSIGGEDAASLQKLSAAEHGLQKLPPLERYAVVASLPDFLAKRFLKELGEEADAFGAAINERAPLCARVNLLKGDREALIAALKQEEVNARPTPLSPVGVYLETRINAFSLAAFRSGLFEIQDEGSQLLGMLVDAPPTKVVDACAGAGGKTLQLAAQMKNRGELFALDIETRRLDDLRDRARRDGVHNVRVKEIPKEGPEVAAALEFLKGKADRVLVDAPCTGTGTFRRKPDARWRLEESEIAEHAQRQGRLLDAFAAMVKPGGRMIYGTCSILREENEDVIEAFLKRTPGFRIKPAIELLGPQLASVCSGAGFLRLYPHKHNTDGFFGAVLVKIP